MRESEVTQSCPTLSDPMDWSLPGSSIPGIFQARVLEWGAKYTLGLFKKRLEYTVCKKKQTNKKKTLITELFSFKLTPILVTFPGTCMRLNTFEEMVVQIVSKF